MKKNIIFWLLTGLFLLSSIIDIIDGYLPKLMSSIFLTIGFFLLALNEHHPNLKVLRVIAISSFIIAALFFIYRLFAYLTP